ncbi:hypothetical protein ACVWWN_002075 [Mycobacterium sp. URHB0021]
MTIGWISSPDHGGESSAVGVLNSSSRPRRFSAVM